MRRMFSRPQLSLIVVFALGAGCAAKQGGAPGNAGGAASADMAPAEPGVTSPDRPPAPEPMIDTLPHWKHGENPFVNVGYWSDPYAPARLNSRRLKTTKPDDAALFEKIADHGGADWIGDWTPNVQNWVGKRVTMILKAKALPIFIAYNIPKRDCGQYSAGGAAKGDAYKKWITAFANGIGQRRAAVILEPDALGLLTKCLSPEDQKERLELLKFAVHSFASLGNTAVYIDAGNPGWHPPAEMAKRLKEAGIDEAEGFALNVSNYKSTEANLKYGKDVSKLLGGKHFVIDTSRNGNGAPTACEKEGGDSESCWCNPPGRALGSPPTAQTADPAVDAYLWLKKPGESDGKCNGGPKAGDFWPEQALELARNAKY